MTDLLEAMIAYKDHLSTNALPDDVMNAVKTFTIDTIAVGIAGAAAPLTKPVRDAAVPWGPVGDAPLLGPGDVRVSAGSAAFINGFQIHCQEYDCVHEPAVVHPMATVFAALSADCSGRGSPTSGDWFARGIALGVHVAATLGVAATSPIQFFRPANAGIFGATIGISFLRGLTEQQTYDAMGYALSFNSGTMQAHVEGKPALPIQIGNAARASIMACDLAEAGLAGTRNTLEGPFGYFNLFEREVDLSGIADSFHQKNRMVEVSHKPFPTGRAAHGGIVLMQRLRAEIDDLSRIKSVGLSAPPLIERLVGRPIIHDLTANYARLCFAYLGAVTLRHGGVSLDAFTDRSLECPDVHTLAEKIRVTTNDVQDPAAFVPQVLTAELTDGSTIRHSTEALLGSPSDPLSVEAQREKVENCIRYAYGANSEGFADDLWSEVERVDQISDINDIIGICATNELSND